ncbi:hypothetical protein SLS62_006542 [Diatrype stigma]|uniref:EamA domain-containing protein n=1 Tax=Diatrype stigma TaxID=117547 RepID=A0AAN9YR31_9PEZI
MNYGTTTSSAPGAASVHQEDGDASRSPSSSDRLAGATTSPVGRSPGSSSGAGSGSESGPEAGGRSEPSSHRDDENEEEEAGEEGRGQQRWRSRVWGDLKGFYQRNIGLFFVFLAQTFGSVMNTAAKLLTSGDGSSNSKQFHALQIIFVRMLATAVLGFLYMWYQQVPDFPFGKRNIRGLLVLRGFAGFSGLFGSYYALTYLNLADATVISFLVPTLTAFVCYVWLRFGPTLTIPPFLPQEPYTPKEALAGLIALAGVLLVARPPFLFPREAVADPRDSDSDDLAMVFLRLVTPDQPSPRGIHGISGYGGGGLVPPEAPSPSQRGLAVLCAVLGTFAAATAYTTIRVIGKRAHSLVSVNYYALVATVGSAAIILVHPDLEFVLPRGALQWTLLTIIGIAGFLLQFLLTEGLKREKAGRATNMTYLQMVFALIIERVVWGTTPPPLSLLGAVLIIGAAIWLSLQRNQKPNEEQQQQKKKPVLDEESSLLGGPQGGGGELRRD